MGDKIKIGYNDYTEEVRAERLAFARRQMLPLHIGIASTAIIGPEVEIGIGCEIRHNVIIMGRVIIGDHCLIRAGAIIGEEGFSVEKDIASKTIIRVRQHGGIVIGNHVDVGCYTTINRSTLAYTIIGDYTKIAHRVNVGHNVTIGKRVILNVGTCISGGSTLGDDCFTGVGAAISGKLNIGVESVVGQGSLVLEDVPDRAVVIGRPAKILRYI